MVAARPALFRLALQLAAQPENKLRILEADPGAFQRGRIGLPEPLKLPHQQAGRRRAFLQNTG